jgi:DNA-binding response OmpR family regulator
MRKSLQIKSASSTTAEDGLTGMRECILVVDDEPDVTALLRFHLRRRGHDVLVADNGLQALNLARRHLPALVVLDIGMEGIDGYTVCEILRHQPSTSNLQIIMLTGRAGQIPRLNSLESGANDFVNKPFDLKDLLQRVDAALESYRQRQQVLLGSDEGATSH